MVNSFFIGTEMTVRSGVDSHSIEGLGRRKNAVNNFPVDIA